MKRFVGRPFILLLFFCLIPAVVCAEGESEQESRKPPKPEDFAGTLVLSGTGGTLLGFEIPEEIYRGLERPDRGDIRVFDADGVLVPFVSRPVPGTQVLPPPEEVPFFRWQQGNSTTLPGSADIEIDTSGAVVRIRGAGTMSQTAQTYLLDLSALPYPPVSLALTLEEADEFYHSAAAVFTSNNLSQWKEYNTPQAVARFGTNGIGNADAGANRNTIELPQTTGDAGAEKYLLLKFDREIPVPRVIHANFAETLTPPAHRETIVHGERQGNRNTIDYYTGGFYPITGIEFRLPEADSINVNIKNKVRADDDWRFFAHENLYRIKSGNSAGSSGSDSAGNTELKNAAIPVTTAAPWWELEAAGDQTFASVPDCHITWEPWEIIFIGRGKGPWTCVWGNAAVGRSSDSSLTLQSLAAGAPAIERATLQGQASYRETPSKAAKPAVQSNSPWLLWGILILSVIVLTCLAYAVARSMGKGK
ncbi:hypothetical protein FACS1894147_03160 [Spirochaetia bacterium]|nr:hypothetical protein FACS1894147_03160 [Spirochaetia bacterium]